MTSGIFCLNVAVLSTSKPENNSVRCSCRSSLTQTLPTPGISFSTCRRLTLKKLSRSDIGYLSIDFKRRGLVIATGVSCFDTVLGHERETLPANVVRIVGVQNQ